MMKALLLLLLTALVAACAAPINEPLEEAAGESNDPSASDGPALATAVVDGPSPEAPTATAEPASEPTSEPTTTAEAAEPNTGGSSAAVDVSRGEELSASDARIVFTREGGFAGLSDTWTIHADGRFEHARNGLVRTAPDVATELLTTLVDGGFFDLAPAYIDKNHCCDFFSFTLTVTANEQTHTVETMEATPSMPDNLAEMIQRVNMAVSVAPES